MESDYTGYIVYYAKRTDEMWICHTSMTHIVDYLGLSIEYIGVL